MTQNFPKLKYRFLSSDYSTSDGILMVTSEADLLAMNGGGRKRDEMKMNSVLSSLHCNTIKPCSIHGLIGALRWKNS